ncbi:MAG: tripartite tricarboxylate transporter TctB family protein, partial [Pseudomonadota bacterium]
ITIHMAPTGQSNVLILTESEIKMGKADRISSTFWFIFALVVIVKSYRLGLGSLGQPGPGFLFFWSGILLGIMSLVIFIQTFVKSSQGGPEKPILGGVNYKKIIMVSLAVFVYALLLDFLGFILVTLLLFVFILGVVERKKWMFTILSSMLVTAAAFLIFQTWLETQLPKGLFGFLRF